MSIKSSYDKLAALLNLCTAELKNPDFPQLILNEYVKLIPVTRCHVACLREDGTVKFMDQLGSTEMMSIYVKYERNDPLMPYNSPSSEDYQNFHFDKKEIKELAKENILYDAWTSAFPLCDVLATKSDKLNAAFVGVRIAQRGLTQDHAGIHEIIGIPLLNCYLKNKEYFELHRLAGHQLTIIRDFLRKPFVLFDEHGTILAADDEATFLMKRSSWNKKRIQRLFFDMRARLRDYYAYNIHTSASEEIRKRTGEYLFRLKEINLDGSCVYTLLIERIDKTITLLTQREGEIVGLIAEGYTNREIAKHLGISTETVKRHISNAFRKTGSRNRIELITKSGIKVE